MPRHASDNLAETFAKILCERASFELKEEDVNAYRQHISSLQQAAQFTAAARAHEDEEYRQWVVRNLQHTSSVKGSVTCDSSFKQCTGTRAGSTIPLQRSPIHSVSFWLLISCRQQTSVGEA